MVIEFGGCALKKPVIRSRMAINPCEKAESWLAPNHQYNNNVTVDFGPGASIIDVLNEKKEMRSDQV